MLRGVPHAPMTSHNLSETDHLRSQVWGLAVACPVGPDNPEGCPLHDVRRCSLTDRLKWVRSLRHEELAHIVGVHCACIAAKQIVEGA